MLLTNAVISTSPQGECTDFQQRCNSVIKAVLFVIWTWKYELWVHLHSVKCHPLEFTAGNWYYYQLTLININNVYWEKSNWEASKLLTPDTSLNCESKTASEDICISFDEWRGFELHTCSRQFLTALLICPRERPIHQMILP